MKHLTVMLVAGLCAACEFDVEDGPMMGSSSARFAAPIRVGVAYRVTVIVDPDNTIQHIYGTNLNVGRNPKDTLRVLDALQTDELCPCNREVGGDTLKAA